MEEFEYQPAKRLTGTTEWKTILTTRDVPVYYTQSSAKRVVNAQKQYDKQRADRELKQGRAHLARDYEYTILRRPVAPFTEFMGLI